VTVVGDVVPAEPGIAHLVELEAASGRAHP
jgi:hypothetical protein